MKLLNHTLSYLATALLFVLGVWATLFYINMLDEIYDSIDDGLENSKLLIIEKVQSDSTLLSKTSFGESNYAIHQIPAYDAYRYRDVYYDSALYMQREVDFEPVRILETAFRAANGNYYQLQVVSSMVEEDDLIEDLLFSIIWLYVLLLASILIINNFLLKSIWKPFYHILSNLKKFKPGDEDQFKNIPSRVKEFKMLDEAVIALMLRTNASFSDQKQFIENAAHEIQTPLAISINKLELLSESHSLTDDQIRDIGAVIDSLERLTRLNKSLLLLSRISNKQFSNEALVDFNNLTEKWIADFSDVLEFKKVTIAVTQHGTFRYPMDQNLAHILISNLLKNALVHNIPGGKISVQIAEDHISVENDSRTSPLGEKIFKRFYKNTDDTNSTGLGLAIVKSICDHYQLIVRYNYNGKHMFSVHLPKS